MGAKRELRIFLGAKGATALFVSAGVDGAAVIPGASAPAISTSEASVPQFDDLRPLSWGPGVVAKHEVYPFDHLRFVLDAHGVAAHLDGAPLAAPPRGAAPLTARSRDDALLQPAAGRPLRVDGVPQLARPRAWGAWSDRPEPLVAGLDPATRQTLGEAWLGDALDEHAAVGAFARLALALLAIGAPSTLVARTEQAAIEEVEHARLCFALASAYLGTAVGPGPLEVGPISPPEIVDLALESWRDGCLGEGAAAAVARAARRRAHDPAVCAALTIISRDEGAHAELGWDILGLCLSRGGREVADALREEVARMPHALDLPDEDVGDALAALLAEHGYLTAADRARCAAENARTAVRRAGWLLAPGQDVAPGGQTLRRRVGVG